VKTLLSLVLVALSFGSSPAFADEPEVYDPQAVMNVAPVLHGPPMTSGVIARWEGFAGKHLRLIDGRYVDLHDYTVIEPRDGQLRPGQHISIRGFFAPGTRDGHVTMNALAITIINGDGMDH